LRRGPEAVLISDWITFSSLLLAPRAPIGAKPRPHSTNNNVFQGKENININFDKPNFGQQCKTIKTK